MEVLLTSSLASKLSTRGSSKVWKKEEKKKEEMEMMKKPTKGKIWEAKNNLKCRKNL